MIGHYTPGKYSKTFIFHTIIPTIKQHLSVNIPGKHINPVDYHISDKIQIGFFIKFIFSANCRSWSICKKYQDKNKKLILEAQADACASYYSSELFLSAFFLFRYPQMAVEGMTNTAVGTVDSIGRGVPFKLWIPKVRASEMKEGIKVARTMAIFLDGILIAIISQIFIIEPPKKM